MPPAVLTVTTHYSSARIQRETSLELPATRRIPFYHNQVPKRGALVPATGA
jgi:hypothetical protein